MILLGISFYSRISQPSKEINSDCFSGKSVLALGTGGVVVIVVR